MIEMAQSPNTILRCPRCGNLPTIHKTTLGDKEAFAIYCDANTIVGNLGWYFNEEEAIDAWNIKAIERAFLDGKMTWEDAKMIARSLADEKP